MFSNIKKAFSCSQDINLNIFIIFKPFYYILTVVGLFPFGIKYNETKARCKIVHNVIYLNAVCALSIILMIYAFFFIHVRDLWNVEEVDSLADVFITQINYVLELSTLVLYCTVAYISAYLYRYKYVKILNSVTSVLAESKNEPASRTEILERLRFQVHVVVGSLLFVFILQLCVNCSRDDKLWKITLVTFSFILPQIIQMIGLGFHYILVMMLVAILSDINQQLLWLSKEPRAPIAEDVLIKVESKRTTLCMKHLQMVYSKTFDIKCDINEIFRAPLLMSTIQCFHCIVSEGYSLYHGIIAHTHSVHNTVNNTIWMAYQLVKVFSVAYSGSKLVKESKKVGQTLHIISADKQDIRTLLEIQHFSTSMTYQEFVLSVYGYFDLNSNLIASMVATATMYLIILVQFDKSSLNPKVSP